MIRIVLVAVGYSRPDSMQSLLDSILRADYENDQVDLVISVDKGMRQDEVVKVAETLDWQHGKKIIRKFEHRQGLRQHILQCGDLTEQYDAVIVLEDDLNVSPGFYSYCKQAIMFYGKDERIGGISLYSDEINQTVQRYFAPEPNGYDVYMMNLATSWGECWTRRMWQDFRTWYAQAGEELVRDSKIPENIVRWDNRSWLKYFDRFVIETNKYFIYPYWALTTNCSDAGEHFAEKDSDYQIPLLSSTIKYRFPNFEDAVKYDAFHERLGLENILSELKGNIVLDLNGGRTIIEQDADYLVSSQSLPYEVVRELSLDRRPIELNCVYPSAGKGLYVYDVHRPAKAPKKNEYYVARYDVRHLDWHLTLSHFCTMFLRSLKSHLKRKK